MNANNLEFLRPDVWIENNIKILHPRQGLVPFKLYPFQKFLLKTIGEQRYVITNKFRQSGISTLKVAYGLWEAMWHLDQSIVFLTRTDREAIMLNRMMRRMIDYLPDDYQVKPDICNDHHIHFNDTNSEIHFWKVDAYKAKRITHLYIDEAAFIPDMKEHWKAIYPCISLGGKVTVSSTPNGAYGWYWEVFRDALLKKNDFYPVRLNYLDHPDYSNLDWERQMLRSLGFRGFIQEVAATFMLPKEEEDELFKNRWDELEQKEEVIRGMIAEYGKIVDKLEAALGRDIYRRVEDLAVEDQGLDIPKSAEEIEEIANERKNV